MLQLQVTGAIPYVLAAVVYFPLICCNLEDIDLMPCPTRTRFTDMDCCKASLIDAEHCRRVLSESAVKQVDARQATLAGLLLFFMIPLLEAQRLESCDAGSAPLIFLPSISAGAVCHCRQVCACHLHGDFI